MNLLQNASGGSVVNGKAVIYGTNGDIVANQIKLGNTIITSNADELNILDGVTASKDELNLLDGATSASVSSNKAVIADNNLDINGVRNITLSGNANISGNITMGSTSIVESDISVIENNVAGTGNANKVVVLDSNKDIAGINNLLYQVIYQMVPLLCLVVIYLML